MEKNIKDELFTLSSKLLTICNDWDNSKISTKVEKLVEIEKGVKQITFSILENEIKINLEDIWEQDIHKQ